MVNVFYWKLKDKNIEHTISWKILAKAKPYSTANKHCKLCLNAYLSTVVWPRYPKMDEVWFDYSSKNIPTPPRNSYLKSLIEKVECVIKRVRWKAFFFDRNEQDNKDAVNNDNFAFKSRTFLPNNELDKFEADLLDIVHNIKFRNVNNKFQNKLNEDISKIKKSTKAFIPADNSWGTASQLPTRKLAQTPPISLMNKQNLWLSPKSSTAAQNKSQNNKLLLS